MAKFKPGDLAHLVATKYEVINPPFLVEVRTRIQLQRVHDERTGRVFFDNGYGIFVFGWPYCKRNEYGFWFAREEWLRPLPPLKEEKLETTDQAFRRLDEAIRLGEALKKLVAVWANP